VGWRVRSWDAARGGGVISSDAGELAFDASVAMVDRFEVGESVEVSLVRDPTGYRVTRIEPVAWRPPPSPPPIASLAAELRAIEQRLGGQTCPAGLFVADERVQLRMDAPRPWSVVFSGAAFVQAPLDLDVARLSGFALGPFLETEAAAGWPAAALPVDLVAFRIEPDHFRGPVGYVVARHLHVED
jgi:hypothetical protein